MSVCWVQGAVNLLAVTHQVFILLLCCLIDGQIDRIVAVAHELTPSAPPVTTCLYYAPCPFSATIVSTHHYSAHQSTHYCLPLYHSTLKCRSHHIADWIAVHITLLIEVPFTSHADWITQTPVQRSDHTALQQSSGLRGA